VLGLVLIIKFESKHSPFLLLVLQVAPCWGDLDQIQI